MKLALLDMIAYSILGIALVTGSFGAHIVLSSVLISENLPCLVILISIAEKDKKSEHHLVREISKIQIFPLVVIVRL